MDERNLILRIKAKWPIKEGTKAWEITQEQQRACNLVGKLLAAAHRKGKRKKGAWL